MARLKGLSVSWFLLSFVSRLSLAALPLPDNYDSSTRPNQGSVADVVNVSAELHAIRGVHESTSEMTVDISIHTSWVDSRLFGQVTRDTLFVDQQIPHIWLPNVQIANAASSTGGGVHILQLNKDGLIKLSEKRTAKITCHISQAKYPFDKQLCRLEINSLQYNTIHLKLFWNNILSSEVPTYHPEFSFSHTEQTSENIKTPTGEYSNLYLEIGVTRCPLRVIFRAMLPTLFLLALSYYVSFCHCPILKGNKKPSVETAAAVMNGTGTHNNHNNHYAEAGHSATTSHSNSPSPTSYSPVPCMPLSSSPTFNLILVGINGMIFMLTMLIAQINFIESPKSSAVSGLDVWANVISSIQFVILWHSIQLYFNAFTSQRSSHSKNGNDSCYVNKTTSILKLGIPLVVAVFLVIFFGVYLS